MLYACNKIKNKYVFLADYRFLYVTSTCSFKGIGVDSVIESLEANDSERNALLSDLWEND